MKDFLNMHKIKYSEKGVTLIELLLYVAIIATLMNTLVPFAQRIISGGARSATQQEVYSQARYVAERIKYEIRTANAINASNFNSNLAANPTHQLSVTHPTNGTTLIKVTAGGQVTITQGANPAVNLNSNATRVTYLLFENYTSGTSTEHITFTLTMQTAYQGQQIEFRDSVTLRSSGEVRTN